MVNTEYKMVIADDLGEGLWAAAIRDDQVIAAAGPLRRQDFVESLISGKREIPTDYNMRQWALQAFERAGNALVALMDGEYLQLIGWRLAPAEYFRP